jgi:hypothetical protein
MSRGFARSDDCAFALVRDATSAVVGAAARDTENARFASLR